MLPNAIHISFVRTVRVCGWKLQYENLFDISLITCHFILSSDSQLHRKSVYITYPENRGQCTGAAIIDCITSILKKPIAFQAVG